MKLSEKIQLLRKENGYSQEELAAICNVSRQSISKWEADIALPETEKLIKLTNIQIENKINKLSFDECNKLCDAMDTIISIIGK